MKKILFTLLFGLTAMTISLSMPINEVSVYVVECSDGEEYVDTVTAQNMNGTKTKTFTVYGRRMANGKYRFFVKVSTREFPIQYANNNKYKPFYININGERWYFQSKTLDFYSGKTDQW